MADLLLQLLLLGCGPALVAAYLAPGTWSDAAGAPAQQHAPPVGSDGRVFAGTTCDKPAAGHLQCPAATRYLNATDLGGPRETLRCFSPVATKEACCGFCGAEPACASFVWREKTLLKSGDELPSACWLKSCGAKGGRHNPTHWAAQYPGRHAHPAPPPAPPAPPPLPMPPPPPMPTAPPAPAPNVLGFEWQAASAAFAVTVDGTPWLTSGPISLHGNTAPAHVRTVPSVNGSDTLGDYLQHGEEWSTTVGQEAVTVQTLVQIYRDTAAIVFELRWPNGAADTVAASSGLKPNDEISSVFPSFGLAGCEGKIGYLTWGDHQSGWAGVRTGDWCGLQKGGSSAQASLPSAGMEDSAPYVLFNPEQTTALVISSFSSFMVHSWNWERNLNATQGEQDGGMGGVVMQAGLMGSVTSVPVGFSLKTVVSLGRGVNDAMTNWGRQMQKAYATDRTAVATDRTLRELGFSTDNGAFYYYHTDAGKSYEDTLLDVYAYSKEKKIPYTYVLIDSWWYYKGRQGGVTDWSPMPHDFPTGLNATSRLRTGTGWAIQAHNRYWSAENICECSIDAFLHLC